MSQETFDLSSFDVDTRSAWDESVAPRTEPREEKNSDIIAISRNARNLLVRHGFLAAFVLGVYGDTVRIARYDRSSALVSMPFDIRSDPVAIQRFLWNFVHPRVGDTVVGCDPTIRALSPEDERWTKEALARAGIDKKCIKEEVGEIKKGRMVQVWDEDTHEERWYIIYKLVEINARLFSRSTMVWKALRDTRADDVGEDKTGAVEINIYKEAWRQVVRECESVFYRRIASKIPDYKLCGLTKLICGGDLGQREVAEWAASSSNAGTMRDAEFKLRLRDAASVEAQGESLPDDSETPLSPADQSSCADTIPAAPSAAEQSSKTDFPLPYPQHQTFSWKLFDESLIYRERSHVRFVVKDVGRPITEFKNTRELITAIRDAIKGTPFIDFALWLCL